MHQRSILGYKYVVEVQPKCYKNSIKFHDLINPCIVLNEEKHRTNMNRKLNLSFEEFASENSYPFSDALRREAAGDGLHVIPQNTLPAVSPDLPSGLHSEYK